MDVPSRDRNGTVARNAAKRPHIAAGFAEPRQKGVPERVEYEWAHCRQLGCFSVLAAKCRRLHMAAFRCGLENKAVLGFPIAGPAVLKD